MFGIKYFFKYKIETKDQTLRKKFFLKIMLNKSNNLEQKCIKGDCYRKMYIKLVCSQALTKGLTIYLVI